MGDPVLITGAAGVVVVIILAWLGPRVAGWLERYHRAHGYEADYARHVAGSYPVETYATVTIPRADVAGAPPWPITLVDPGPPDPLDPYRGAVWQSDLERAGRPLPGWARVEADRVGAYGLNSGSSGSDYHEHPAAGGGGWCRPVGMGTPTAGGAGSEAYGPPGRPHPNPFALPDPDEATWLRLLEAWGDIPPASIRGDADTRPASQPMGGGQAGEDNRSTGTATRELALGPGSPLGITGRGGVVPVTAAAAPGPRDAAAVASPGPGSRLATRFDVELAADAAAYMRAQNRSVAEDMAARLERLERACGVRL